ncbi:MAG TPA: SDR family oxidoreductase [Xanthobacteraceae bacterium]|nr:SDR family oxidoreductase [Xanthobacteraceae bacterium]
MKVEDKIVVVTGGADGIGKALCERFHKEGAKAVVVADLNGAKAEAVAKLVGGKGYKVDVANEQEIVKLIDDVEKNIGPIDLFCSNAGLVDREAKPDDVGSATNASWTRSWNVHVMAHVYAARALLPRMIARGGGYFLNTASAAGLLSQIGSAVYATTKHAAVAFGEILAITHRDQGIRVSMLCPQGVDTPLLRSGSHGPQHLDGVLTPEQCADAVIKGLEAETFLILPHPQVAQYMRNKAENYDRWLGGMVKLKRSLEAGKA